MVEGVHFKLEWGTPQTLGARALAVNLSDIAAMGGVPTAGVVNLAVRPGPNIGFFDKLYSGLEEAAAAAGVDVVGGNITRASQLAITVTLLGEARDGILRRDAARPGDAVYVTGTLGDAALGWRILDGKLHAQGTVRKYLVDRFLRPSARLTAGRKLAQMRPPPAAIDISDGLWQDLGHILKRSRVGAGINADAVPLSPAYRAVMGDDLEFALGGGDDYELLFCMPPRLSEAALSRRLRVPVRRVGDIVRGTRAILKGGKVAGNGAVLPSAGWDQLRTRD